VSTTDEAPQDPVERLQVSALMAIAAARQLLDALEGVVVDRDRLQRLADTGRHAVESAARDAGRVWDALRPDDRD
jgi:hypothetical protein